MATMAAEARPGHHHLKLLAWLSPAMPVGTFTYSHGLETAVEAGLVHDACSLQAHCVSALAFGAARSDAIWLRRTYHAAQGRDPDACLRLLHEAAAMRGATELSLESTQPGRSLADVLQVAWPSPHLAHLLPEARGACPYACVLGLAAAAHGVPLALIVSGFLHAFVANLVSAGVRLVPLGAIEGQRVIAALEPLILEVEDEVLEPAEDELGTSTPALDLLSIAHERQMTRLFRS